MQGQAITKNQIKEIHTLIHAMKWKDEWYKDHLYGYFEVESSKCLTKAQADDYIEVLKKQATSMGVWKPAWLYRREKEREGMATDKQLKKIRSMYKEAWDMYVEILSIKGKIDKDVTSKDREISLRKFLFKQRGIEDLKWLKKEDASKFIDALNGLKETNANTLLRLKKEKERAIVNG